MRKFFFGLFSISFRYPVEAIKKVAPPKRHLTESVYASVIRQPDRFYIRHMPL